MGSSTVATAVWSLTCIHKPMSHYVWLSLKKFLGPLKPFLEVLPYPDMTLLLFHARQEGNELMEICTYSDCLWKCSELTQIYFLMFVTPKTIILLFLRTSSFTWHIFLLILFVSRHPEPSVIQPTPLWILETTKKWVFFPTVCSPKATCNISHASVTSLPRSK